jgi:hypothetical protein
MRHRLDPGTLAGLSLMFGLLCLCAALGVVMAREQYAGQFDGLDPATRSWFKSVRSPHGVPCCDIADGHLTDFKVDEGGHYFVPISGIPNGPDPTWVLVPPEAVILNVGNPYDKAVVWYVINGPESIYIRCFVPTGGV